MVSWTSPLHQNGVVVLYQVKYNTRNGNTSNTINAPSLEQLVSGLHPYTAYAFSVRAATKAGSRFNWGPLSSQSESRTLEAG